MIDADVVKKLIDDCQFCITIFVVSLASTISGVRPEEMTYRSFLKGLVATLSFVLAGAAMARHFKLGDLETIAISFLFGRFSFLLDGQIAEVIKYGPKLLKDRYGTKKD